jgi:hypothetical protein
MNNDAPKSQSPNDASLTPHPEPRSRADGEQPVSPQEHERAAARILAGAAVRAALARLGQAAATSEGSG